MQLDQRTVQTLMNQLSDLKEAMQKDPVEYRRQMAMLQNLRKKLEPQQQAQMDQILRSLGL